MIRDSFLGVLLRHLEKWGLKEPSIKTNATTIPAGQRHLLEQLQSITLNAALGADSVVEAKDGYVLYGNNKKLGELYCGLGYEGYILALENGYRFHSPGCTAVWYIGLPENFHYDYPKL